MVLFDILVDGMDMLVVLVLVLVVVVVVVGYDNCNMVVVVGHGHDDHSEHVVSVVLLDNFGTDDVVLSLVFTCHLVR